MTSIREEYIGDKFNEWLDRFTPPRGILNNLDAQQRDANAMMATVLRYAPAREYGDWMHHMLTRLEENMTTRSWPAPGELAKACKGMATDAHGETDRDKFEPQAIQRMAEWFSKFGTQMPGHGRDSRTAALIAQGVLKDEREARFKGFSMTPEMSRRANGQRMGRDEWRHHVRVMAQLRGVEEAEAEMSIRAEAAQGPADRDTTFSPKRIEAAE